EGLEDRLLLHSYTFFPTQYHPYDVARGGDGNIWFTTGSSLGKLTPLGQVTYVPLPAGHWSQVVETAADGGLWFAGSPEEVGHCDIQHGFGFLQLPDTVRIVSSSTYSSYINPAAFTADMNGSVWWEDSRVPAAYPYQHLIDHLHSDGSISQIVVSVNGVTTG